MKGSVRLFILLILAVISLIYWINKWNKLSDADMEIFDLTDLQPAFEVVFQPTIKELANCTCTSKQGNSYDFCYRLPQNRSIVGKKFSCEFVDAAEELGVLGSGTVDLSSQDLPGPVFVSAFDEKFSQNAFSMINSIRNLFPDTSIIVYNLGRIGTTNENILKVCNLHVREFNFTHYGLDPTKLREYSWKPIVIAETLREFGAIWYLDSSVRFDKAELENVHALVSCQRGREQRRPRVRKVDGSNEPIETGFDREVWEENVKNCEKIPYLLHGFSAHGIFPVVNPGMYTYLPADLEAIKKTRMYDAGFVFTVHTDRVVKEVLKWYVLCALQQDCFAPPGSSLYCNFEKGRYTNYANCHRFDQSAVNILLANANNNDHRLFSSQIAGFFRIARNEFWPYIKKKYLCN